MARPTKLTDELLESAEDYLSNYTTQIPSVAGLALHLGVSRETIYAWDNDNISDKFSDILSRVRSLQETKLVDKGLTGEFNSTITKLMLTKHGYSDRTEQEIKVRGKIISPLGGESVRKDNSNQEITRPQQED